MSFTQSVSMSDFMKINSYATFDDLWLQIKIHVSKKYSVKSCVDSGLPRFQKNCHFFVSEIYDMMILRHHGTYDILNLWDSWYHSYHRYYDIIAHDLSGLFDIPNDSTGQGQKWQNFAIITALLGANGIPGSSQLRQNSGVGQEIANFEILLFLKNLKF